MQPPSPVDAPRLQMLTVLRFPAALVVFIFHVTLPQIGLLSSEVESHSTLRWLADPAGGLGVTFFFILSGFVISWSHKPGDRVRSFWRRRFVKILPLYWLSGILAVMINPDRLHLLPGYLVMSEAWFTHPATALGLNAPGWSLCVEAFFYALFPLFIAPLMHKCRTRMRATVLAVGALIAIAGIVLLATYFNTGVAMPLDPNVKSFGYWIAYVSPLFRLPEFVLGGCLAIAVRSGWIKRAPILPALVCLICAYILCLYAPTLWSHRAILVIPSAWLILSASLSRTYARGTDAPRWLMLLGELSFGFYLVHYPVLELVAKWSKSSDGLKGISEIITLALTAFVIAVAVAWILYFLIERPLVEAFGRRETLDSSVSRRPMATK
ncbi:peptidoglycan/LPS O-acetylase OafA/YrhL [Arthrobacter sp. JUb115]|nr:peptidoglycan/LPS O-acetylase OafA/YrhL [Arthrobacter sp. JUb115]